MRNIVEKPVFILGCGRSGTTILGRTLSHHPVVTYLNEPRHLWSLAFPETDVWTAAGKLILTAEDATIEGSHQIRRLFQSEIERTGKPLLVEKLPINNFRLHFLHAIFPDARFIHIFRYGLEVARSISKIDTWFGSYQYRWQLLVEQALRGERTRDLPLLCTDDYKRGLLEWRLSTEAVHSFFQAISPDRFTEILYDELVEFPAASINRLLSFLHLKRSTAVEIFANREIKAKSSSLKQQFLSEAEERLSGDLLRLYQSKRCNS